MRHLASCNPYDTNNDRDPDKYPHERARREKMEDRKKPFPAPGETEPDDVTTVPPSDPHRRAAHVAH
jgi:hypothetical protein